MVDETPRADIYILQTNSGQFVVDPATFYTSPQCKEPVVIRHVWFQNSTSYTAVLSGEVFAAADDAARTLEPGSKRRLGLVDRPGAYEYEVTIHDQLREGRRWTAVGHSSPRIIVDP